MTQTVKSVFFHATLLTFILLSIMKSHAQEQQSHRFDICFEVGASTIDSGFRDNRRMLGRLDSLLSTLGTNGILSLRIVGSTSPEGRQHENFRLSQQRAYSLRDHILTRYPQFTIPSLEAVGIGENWEALRTSVAADNRTPRQKQILYIIDHIPARIHLQQNRSRKKSLMDLGKPVWEYLLANHFPELRGAVSLLIVTAPEDDSLVEMAVPEEPDRPVSEEAELPDLYPDESPAAEPSHYVVGVDSLMLRAGSGKPLFAIKSNLLLDAVTALNIEVEVPLGKKWSVAAEYIFPWWLLEHKQYCLQLQSAQLEGRYWFGDRNQHPLLTGFFAGVFTGTGYYDLEWGKKGYQGEFLVSAGFSGGFVHTLGSRFRMEYALGVGYLQTRYREYEPLYGADDAWHLIRRSSGRYSWVGPTRAKISLVWFIRTRGKGGNL